MAAHAGRTSTASPLDRHTPPTQRRGSGRTTTAFVLGVIGVVAAFLLPLLGLILGIVAIVMSGGRAKGSGRPWQGSAGFWLGVAAVVASVAMMVLTGILIASS
jgi:uncharacterized membrane protein